MPPEAGAPKITKRTTTTSVPAAPSTVCSADVANATAIITRVKRPHSTKNFDVGMAPISGPANVSVRSAPQTATMASAARRPCRVADPPNVMAIVDER